MRWLNQHLPPAIKSVPLAAGPGATLEWSAQTLKWPGLEAQQRTFEPQLSFPNCCPPTQHFGSSSSAYSVEGEFKEEH